MGGFTDLGQAECGIACKALPRRFRIPAIASQIPACWRTPIVGGVFVFERLESLRLPETRVSPNQDLAGGPGATHPRDQFLNETLDPRWVSPNLS